MQDLVEFEAPFGFVGRSVELLVLDRHMRYLMDRRNRCIKEMAESDGWKRFLD